MEISIGSKTVKVVRRNGMKRILITVCSDGNVRISAPYGVSNDYILSFFESNRAWVERRSAARRATAAEYSQKLLQSGEKVLIWGEEYLLRIEQGKNYTLRLNSKPKTDFGDSGLSSTVLPNVRGDAGSPSASTVNAMSDLPQSLFLPTAEFTVKAGSTQSQRIAAYERCIKRLLFGEISKRLPQIEQRLGLHSSEFRIRSMKSCWGTCNVKTAKLCFNLHLVKAPPQCLDYVITHELGHLLYPNHGAAFKTFMNENFPNWHAVRALLNKNGRAYMIRLQ